MGSAEWYAAVAAANLANSDHMAEEEREGLTDFRHLASLQRRHDLAVAFIRFETQHYAGVPPVDKDPEGYVRAVEEQIGAAGDEPSAASPAATGRSASAASRHADRSGTTLCNGWGGAGFDLATGRLRRAVAPSLAALPGLTCGHRRAGRSGSSNRFTRIGAEGDSARTGRSRPWNRR